MVEYRIKAHPTEYAGVMFRSRLEATWAAMFDQLKWEWAYEPWDLEGWSPDFIIRGRYRDLLVEVKPTLDMANAECGRVLKAAGADACVMFALDGPRSIGLSKLNGYSPVIGYVSSPYVRARPSGYWTKMYLKQIGRTGIFDTHIDGEKYLGFYTGHQLDEGEEVHEPNDPFVNLDTLWKTAGNITRKQYA